MSGLEFRRSRGGFCGQCASTEPSRLAGQSVFFASVTVAPDGTLDVVFQALTDVPAGAAPGPGVGCYDSYLTPID